MQKFFLSDLCCPKAMLDSKIVNLKSVENNLISTFDKYPLHDGVPDLRLANDRSYTPYDTVLRESPKISHSSDKKDYIKHKHDHFLLFFSDFMFVFNDVRKFGSIHICDDLEKMFLIKNLGVEPLSNEFNTKYK